MNNVTWEAINTNGSDFLGKNIFLPLIDGEVGGWWLMERWWALEAEITLNEKFWWQKSQQRRTKYKKVAQKTMQKMYSCTFIPNFVAQLVGYCIRSTKGQGFDPQETLILIKPIHCKSLWIKEPVKCINVNSVNDLLF